MDKPTAKHTRACLHSPCPEEGGDEVDDGGEAFVGLLVAPGNASKGFYAAEEVFDEMPPLVFFSVMLRISAGSLAERNDGLHVVGAQSFTQPAGIKSLVADQGQAMDAGHESVKAGDVVPLAWQEHEADQIAERIDDDRDLRRQAAARFADGLILSPPFAPVPCWWTRTNVASMRTYSKSDASDRCSKIRSHTSFCAHRQKRV